MKEKRKPDRSDLEAIRNQILDFACAKHDFKLESEDFPFEGNWDGIFLIKFRDEAEEDRLYCEAPLGEHFVRFGLDLYVDEQLWQREWENVLRKASGYDVAVYPSISPEGGKRRCRLSARAWIPNFGQRIFGLTLSTLVDCKQAILSMIKV
ncbi:MAG TPA: hypothetical protein ACFYD7_08675 [Candidatus Wujingus californicus]|uniref:hypothetical protein n=1 Tax=Candidatus Wujingus californicus TaxID=3367618 RepID=UPI001D490C7F|nr:hypothetical protein [Planctomycetota bacterium]MDO8132288.1 hypothetical protein [Candidatus Brocadiales bacterium]